MSQALVEQSAAGNKVYESWYNIRNPPKPLSLKARATAAALAACEAEKEAERGRANRGASRSPANPEGEVVQNTVL